MKLSATAPAMSVILQSAVNEWSARERRGLGAGLRGGPARFHARVT